MEYLKLFEEWNIKDPFGRKHKNREYWEKKEKDFLDQCKIDQKKLEAEGLENQNNTPIKEIIDCIENDTGIINAKEAGRTGTINSDSKYIVLSNGIKFALIRNAIFPSEWLSPFPSSEQIHKPYVFNEDDAGYNQAYGIVVDKKYLTITSGLYYKIKEEFYKFMEKTWGSDDD